MRQLLAIASNSASFIVFGGLTACLAVASPAAAAVKVERLGDEFVVNSTTLYGQYYPAAARLSGGKFIIAWTDYSGKQPDDYSTAVRARVFNASGAPQGKDFVVNSSTIFTQELPEAIGLKDGGAIVAWDDDSGKRGDGSQYAVHAQRFAGSGGKAGKEQRLNRITLWTQYHQAIDATKSGGYVAVWEDWSGTGPDTSTVCDIRGQIFSVEGKRIGPEFRANTITQSAQTFPAVAGLSDGSVIVAWADNSQTLSAGMDLRAQLFNATGKRVGKEFLVQEINDGVQDHPSAAALPGGKYVIVWEDRDDTFQTDIKARILKASNTTVVSQFTVNTRTTGDQMQPVVRSFPNGHFVVVWTEKNAGGGDLSGYSVRGQLFGSDGRPLDKEFLVNKTTANNQQDSDVAVLGNSAFVVTWTDYSRKRPDKDTAAVRAQRFRITK